jgi:hypothetical protein
MHGGTKFCGEATGRDHDGKFNLHSRFGGGDDGVGDRPRCGGRVHAAAVEHEAVGDGGHSRCGGRVYADAVAAPAVAVEHAASRQCEDDGTSHWCGPTCRDDVDTSHQCEATGCDADGHHRQPEHDRRRIAAAATASAVAAAAAPVAEVAATVAECKPEEPDPAVAWRNRFKEQLKVHLADRFPGRAGLVFTCTHRVAPVLERSMGLLPGALWPPGPTSCLRLAGS